MTSLGVRAGRHGQWWALAGFVLVVALVAAVGSASAQGVPAEYQSLDRPAWAPPSWLFGPAWTLLYGLIALSGWLVWRRTGFTKVFAVYAAQLACNALWTPLFFGSGQYGLAFADIVLLWLLIAVNIALFWRVFRLAALLLVPYGLWVSYAAALNLAIWLLNA